MDNRKHPRYTNVSLQLPFVGEAPGGQLMEYFLIDLARGGVSFTAPSFPGREVRLADGEVVDFHIPFSFEGELLSRGEIRWNAPSEELNALVYGAKLTPPEPGDAVGAVRFELTPGTGNAVDFSSIGVDAGDFVELLEEGAYAKQQLAHTMRRLQIDAAGGMRVGMPNRGPLLDALAAMRRLAESNAVGLGKAFDAALDRFTRGEDVLRGLHPFELLTLLSSELAHDDLPTLREAGLSEQELDRLLRLLRSMYVVYNSLVLIYANAMRGELSESNSPGGQG